MQPLRALIRNHRNFAIAVLVLAFALRALVPAGYMVSSDPARVFTISVCSDATGGHKTIEVVVPAKPAAPGHGAQEAGKDGTCAFSAIGKAMLGGADPVLLLAALAFVLALGFAAVPIPAVRRPGFLKPPLRGPPTLS